MDWDQYPDLLLPNEVADIFRADPKTVTRWGQQGRFDFIDDSGELAAGAIKTPGGHMRIKKVAAIMAYNKDQEA